jgi:hypothetical protein
MKDLVSISPFFISKHVPSSLAFYRDRLGFEVTFQGPEPDDVYFGIVQRGGMEILLKHIGVAPVPNYTRDVAFFRPLENTVDGLRGFEIEDADGYILFFGLTNPVNESQ